MVMKTKRRQRDRRHQRLREAYRRLGFRIELRQPGVVPFTLRKALRDTFEDHLLRLRSSDFKAMRGDVDELFRRLLNPFDAAMEAGPLQEYSNFTIRPRYRSRDRCCVIQLVELPYVHDEHKQRIYHGTRHVKIDGQRYRLGLRTHCVDRLRQRVLPADPVIAQHHLWDLLDDDDELWWVRRSEETPDELNLYWDCGFWQLFEEMADRSNHVFWVGRLPFQLVGDVAACKTFLHVGFLSDQEWDEGDLDFRNLNSPEQFKPFLRRLTKINEEFCLLYEKEEGDD